jgi:hypothetical protein
LNGATPIVWATRPPFCAVAVESPFSSLREIAYDRVGQFFHTGPWLGRTVLRPVVEVAFAYDKWKYKLDLGQVSPEDLIAATTVPVLLIHRRIDSNIPVRHSRRIAARNPAVVPWKVPNADHGGAVNVAPQEFEQRLIGWFASHSSTRNHFPMSGELSYFRRELEQEVIDPQPEQKQGPVVVAIDPGKDASPYVRGEVLGQIVPGRQGGILDDLLDVVENEAVLQRWPITNDRQQQCEAE